MTACFRQFRGIADQSPATMIALTCFAFLLFFAMFGPLLAPYDPVAGDTSHVLQPPSLAHWFGTDPAGRDVLSRVLVAIRFDLGCAVLGVGLAWVMGTGIGTLAGFYGGCLAWVAARVIDTIAAFPPFVLAVGIAAALGHGLEHLVYAMAIINLPGYVRVSQGRVAALRQAEFLLSAKLYGRNDWHLFVQDVWPNLVPAMMIPVASSIGWTMMHIAGLSFIGIGGQAPTPSWGLLISEGAPFLASGAWWPTLLPGAVLMQAVLCCHVLGDGLRDLMAPRTSYGYEHPAA